MSEIIEYDFQPLFDEVSEFLNKYQKSDIDLCLEAISQNFATYSKNGKQLSKDWGDSDLITTELLKLVAKHLYDESNEEGFPKAIKFYHRYFKDYPHFVMNNATIVKYFLHKHK